MYRMRVFLALACALALSGIGNAQDRGWAASISWSPDGETIAVGSSTGIWFFENDFVELGYVHIEQEEEIAARSLAWNATGDLIAVGFPKGPGHGPYRIIDFFEREIITEITPMYLDWAPIVWHPSENLIATGTYDGHTFIWDAITGDEVFNFTESSDAALPNSTVVFCWNDNTTLTVASKVEIYVIDIVEETVLEIVDPDVAIFDGDCSSDNRLISVSGLLIDTLTGYQIDLDFSGPDPQFDYDTHYAINVAWSPDSRVFVTSREKCLVRVHDGQNGELLTELSGGVYLELLAYSFYQGSIGWHPDSSRFAVVGQFGDIRVWDADTYKLLQRFDGFRPNEHLYSIAGIDRDVECP